MKTAADLIDTAEELAFTSMQLAPQPDDKYSDAKKLIQYHLNSAASKLRQIAEDLAK